MQAVEVDAATGTVVAPLADDAGQQTVVANTTLLVVPATTAGDQANHSKPLYPPSVVLGCSLSYFTRQSSSFAVFLTFDDRLTY